MSEESKEVAPYIRAIQAAKEEFEERIKENGNHLIAKEECLFAMQACQKNDLVLSVAQSNPSSLRMAVINVSLVGLSLNPATAYAFLVPRDKEICLDISYRGLIKIATDTGSIQWAKADVVHAKDKYLYRGLHEEPLHEVGEQNSFTEDRGEMVGAYCIAKTKEGDILVEQMDKEQIMKVRESSKSKGSSYSPWNNYPEEMWKKVVIKRASKTWPKTDKNERLATAIDVINEHEGNIFEQEDYFTQEEWEYLLSCMNANPARTTDLFVFWDQLDNEAKAQLLPKWKRLVKPGQGRRGEQGELLVNAIDEGDGIITAIIVGLNESNDEGIEAFTEQSSDVQQYIKERVSAQALAHIEGLEEAA